jgi:hypothetical protein
MSIGAAAKEGVCNAGGTSCREKKTGRLRSLDPRPSISGSVVTWPRRNPQGPLVRCFAKSESRRASACESLLNWWASAPRTYRRSSRITSIHRPLIVSNGWPSCYSSKVWGTYRQFAALGGQVQRRPADVKPGHWGTQIVFYQQVERTSKDDNGEDKIERCFRSNLCTAFHDAARMRVLCFVHRSIPCVVSASRHCVKKHSPTLGCLPYWRPGRLPPQHHG